MTILEKKSKRKALAIKTLVDNGEYSASFGLYEADRLNDEGKLLDVDYEPLAEYLEALLEEPVDEISTESVENIENSEEGSEVDE